jgi:hypothetical protein
MRLLVWLLQFAGGCRHSRLSNVFTIKKRTYQICLVCGQEFPYSWERMQTGISESVFRHAWVRLRESCRLAPLHDAP